jgi:hypothetical protein
MKVIECASIMIASSAGLLFCTMVSTALTCRWAPSPPCERQAGTRAPDPWLFFHFHFFFLGGGFKFKVRIKTFFWKKSWKSKMWQSASDTRSRVGSKKKSDIQGHMPRSKDRKESESEGPQGSRTREHFTSITTGT